MHISCSRYRRIKLENSLFSPPHRPPLFDPPLRGTRRNFWIKLISQQENTLHMTNQSNLMYTPRALFSHGFLQNLHSFSLYHGSAIFPPLRKKCHASCHMRQWSSESSMQSKVNPIVRFKDMAIWSFPKCVNGPWLWGPSLVVSRQYSYFLVLTQSRSLR